MRMSAAFLATIAEDAGAFTAATFKCAACLLSQSSSASPSLVFAMIYQRGLPIWQSFSNGALPMLEIFCLPQDVTGHQLDAQMFVLVVD